MNKTFLFSLSVLFVISCTNSPKETNKSGNTTHIDTVGSENPILDHTSDVFEKNGEEKTKYANGVTKTLGNYKDSKRDGQWYSWYSTGKPWSETYFENGIKSGPTKTWYENGIPRYEGQYTNDAQTGTWKYYDEKGNLIKVVDHTRKQN